MKIKFLSGPQSGTTAHVRNDVGGPLVAAGLAEIIDGRDRDSVTLEDVREANAANPPDLTPRWSVEIIGGRDARFPLVALVLRIAGQVYSYVGDPKEINATQPFSDGTGFNYASGFGREVPAQWVEAYIRGKKIGPKSPEEITKANAEAVAKHRQHLVDLGVADPPRLHERPVGERGPFRK